MMRAYVWHPRLGVAKNAELSPCPFGANPATGEIATVVAEWDGGIVSRVWLSECELVVMV